MLSLNIRQASEYSAEELRQMETRMNKEVKKSPWRPVFYLLGALALGVAIVLGKVAWMLYHS